MTAQVSIGGYMLPAGLTRARILLTISLMLQVRGLTAQEFKLLEVLADDASSSARTIILKLQELLFTTDCYTI
jgi:hypothetical protein